MLLHILIIDADPSASQITGALVQRIAPQATLTIEATPEQGWWAAQRRPPDVLVIDPSPYGAAGPLLIQLCKEQNPDIRIIVLTSTIAPALRRQIQTLGVHAYLEKPAASAVLVEQMRSGLLGPTSPGPPLAPLKRAPVR